MGSWNAAATLKYSKHYLKISTCAVLDEVSLRATDGNAPLALGILAGALRTPSPPVAPDTALNPPKAGPSTQAPALPPPNNQEPLPGTPAQNEGTSVSSIKCENRIQCPLVKKVSMKKVSDVDPDPQVFETPNPDPESANFADPDPGSKEFF